MLTPYLKKLTEQTVLQKRKVGSAIICKHKNDQMYILLIQRHQDDHWPLFWETPRGGCRENEDITDCVKRETKEETNLDIEIIQSLENFDYTSNNGQTTTTQYNFLCCLKNDNQNVILSKEHQNYKWVSTPGEIELMIQPELKRVILPLFNIQNSLYQWTQFKKMKVSET